MTVHIGSQIATDRARLCKRAGQKRRWIPAYAGMSGWSLLRSSPRRGPHRASAMGCPRKRGPRYSVLLSTVLYMVVYMALEAASSWALADSAFQTWLQSLWPQAQALGISRATFDTATRGLEPDLTLPDLVIP